MLESGFWVSYVQIVLSHIDHSIGKPPFVVEPRQQVHQPGAGNAGLAGVNNRRVRVMVEITAGVRQLGVCQQAFERAAGGSLRSMSFTSCAVVSRAVVNVMSRHDTFKVGTRTALA